MHFYEDGSFAREEPMRESRFNECLRERARNVSSRRSSQWEATDVEDDPAADLLPYCAPAFDQRIAR